MVIFFDNIFFFKLFIIYFVSLVKSYRILTVKKLSTKRFIVNYFFVLAGSTTNKNMGQV